MSGGSRHQHLSFFLAGVTLAGILSAPMRNPLRLRSVFAFVTLVFVLAPCAAVAQEAAPQIPPQLAFLPTLGVVRKNIAYEKWGEFKFNPGDTVKRGQHWTLLVNLKAVADKQVIWDAMKPTFLKNGWTVVKEFGTGSVISLIPGDPILQIAQSMHSWRDASPTGVGRGDLKQNLDTGVWYHISTFGGNTYIQSNTRLDMANWTVPIQVNTASVNNLYAPSCRLDNGTTTSIAYDPGFWYGTLGGWTGWWMWQPVHVAPSSIPGTPPGCFQGLGLVITKLCPDNQPGCDS
jgi:hypothetical protein